MMNRQVTPWKVIAAFVLTAAFLLSCINPQHESGAEPSSPDRGRVRIQITASWTDDSSRTLFPTAPVFSAYRLSFTTLRGQQPMADIRFPSDGSGLVTNIDLEAGEWSISAYGLVMYEGEEKAVAEGSSIITVSANENIEASIVLNSASPGGGNGTFAWSLTIPRDFPADSYSISLFPWGNESAAAAIVTESGTIAPASGEVTISGTTSCANGSYILRASAGTERQRAFYFDVVHIRSFHTTSFVRRAESDEMLPVLILSGSVNVSSFMLNGAAVASGAIEVHGIWAYTSSGERIGYAPVNRAAWRMPLIQMTEASDVYFGAVISVGGYQLELKTEETLQVYQYDIPEIALNIAASILTLRGTLAARTTDNVAQSGWEVRAYTDPLNSEDTNVVLNETPVITNSTGEWSMIIRSFNTLTDIYFSVSKTDSDKIYKRTELKKISVSDQPVSSNIPLAAYFTPPVEVWIGGNLPNAGMGNAKKMLPFQSGEYSENNGRFTFTKTSLEDYASYSFSMLAYFSQGVSAPDWEALNDAKVKYGWSNVIKPDGGISYYDDSGAVGWFNRGKTVKITLDFRGNDYLESGRPMLIVESRDEVYLAGNSFYMGSPDGEMGRYGPDGQNGLSGELRHKVRLDSFYIMPKEVTQGEYESLMPVPKYTNTGGNDFQNSDYPVVNASWFDAVTFANKLSERDGLTPVYTITGSGASRNVSADWTSPGWRLPTEAEWEFAARAGSQTPFAPLNGGNGTTLNTGLANYNGSSVDTGFGYNPIPGVSAGHIVEAGSYTPNIWGLYNMHGNVWEFCWDWYADYNFTNPDVETVNPRGYDTVTGGWGGQKGNGTGGMTPASQGNRIIRGGSYYCSARYLRSAHRGVIKPEESTWNDIGFRLVRIEK